MPRIKRSPSGLLLSRTGVAVPVLTQPFPVPKTIEVTVEKVEPKVGVHFRWNGAKGEHVRIIHILEDSVLADTAIAAGQTVLAINGVPATSSIQAAGLVRASRKSLTITTCPQKPPRPYCKLVSTSATSKDNPPGIGFNSARGRCLVQISRVFRSGCFSGANNLKQGDIVLAVDGIPVSKPEDAERVLQQQTLPYHLLYVVDGMEYRHSIAQELQANGLFQNIRLEDKEQGFLLHVKEQPFELSLDYESHHLVDHQAYLHISSKQARAYRTHVIPFLKAYNEGVEKRMQILEEAVCHEAWKYASDMSALVLESPPPSSPQGREEPNDVATAPRVEDTDLEIPLATAELEVLPLAALQTQLERNANFAIST